ncbi:MAG TPA: metallophosphoesterase [Clostridia bacterium]|nr:metallophosphoesterase [Clostridia bacterium]
MLDYFILLAALIVLAGFFAFENNDIVVSKFTYFSERLPKAFDGFVIAQISDLHNKRFGAKQKQILQKLKDVSPDLIVVTGDVLDHRRYDFAPVMELMQGAKELAPVIYVPGNHEESSGRYLEIKEALLRAGVTVLNDASYTVSRADDTVTVLGVLDPAFSKLRQTHKTDVSDMRRFLNTQYEEDDFTILLSHRAELLKLYSEVGVDLVFAGHAHGGQIRLPFIGGLYAPGQGVFPKYTSGRHDAGDTTMYVSRGLGNSVFPLRIFNRPELVVVTLKVK